MQFSEKFAKVRVRVRDGVKVRVRVREIFKFASTLLKNSFHNEITPGKKHKRKRT